MKRLALADKKRKELLQKMRKRGVIKLTKKELEDIERRKQYWRRFPEQKETFTVDEEESEAGEIANDPTGCETATASEILELRKIETELLAAREKDDTNEKEDRKRKKKEI